MTCILLNLTYRAFKEILEIWEVLVPIHYIRILNYCMNEKTNNPNVT